MISLWGLHKVKIHNQASRLSYNIMWQCQSSHKNDSLWVWRAISKGLHGKLTQRAEHQKCIFLQDVREPGSIVGSLQGLSILRQMKRVNHTLYTIPKKGNKISNWSSLKLLYTKPLINVLNDSFIKRTTLKQSSKSRIKLKRNKIPNITVEKKDQEALRRCKCTHGGSDLVSFSHTAQSRSFFSWIKNYAIYSDFKGDCTLLMNIRGHCSPACLWRTVKTGPRWYHSSADLLFWLWGEPPLSARWQGAVGARLLEKKPEQMFSGRCNDNWADCREQRRQDTLKRE